MTALALICSGCAPDRAAFAEKLRKSLTGMPLTVRLTDCMSGCAKGPTLAFRAPDRMAYLFGPVTEADLPDLATFARLWLDSPDGTLADARPLGNLRTKALARIPA